MWFVRRFAIVLSLLFPLASSADVWSNNGIPPVLASGLKGVGINTAGDWSKCRQGANTNADMSRVLADGWRHIIYVVCIDDVIQINNGFRYNPNKLKSRMRTVTSQIRSLSSRFPNAVFVVAFKSRNQIGGWDAPGLRTSLIYDAYEKSDAVKSSYQQMLRDAAIEAKSISSNKLAFSIMNEPEYHNRGSSALNQWYEGHLALVDSIQQVDPNRVIIVEGIYKSVIGRQRSPSKLMKKLPRKKIIYGFHYYAPHDFTHKVGPGGMTFDKATARKVSKDMKAAAAFSRSKKVPVMLTEFGVWGPYPTQGALKSGVSSQDRASWAAAVYDGTIPKGVGLTWWALHDHNTPYQRLRYAGEKRQPKLVKDGALWQALRLEGAR